MKQGAPIVESSFKGALPPPRVDVPSKRSSRGATLRCTRRYPAHADRGSARWSDLQRESANVWHLRLGLDHAHLLLLRDGHRAALLGLRLRDLLVRVGLIDLQLRADVLADVDVGDVDRHRPGHRRGGLSSAGGGSCRLLDGARGSVERASVSRNPRCAWSARRGDRARTVPHRRHPVLEGGSGRRADTRRS